MTDQRIEGERPTQQPGGGGLAGAIAPEGVAGVLAVLAVVILLAARLAFSGAGGVTPTPRPTAQATPAPTIQPGSPLAGIIGTLRAVNQHLFDARDEMGRELKLTQLDIQAIRAGMATMLVQLQSGTPAAAALAATPAGATVGGQLVGIYGELTGAIGQTQGTNVKDLVKWRAGTLAVVDIVTRILPLDDELAALLAGPGPSASASPSVGPSAPASPSTGPSASPTQQPTTEPSLPPASPTPTPSASVAPSASPGPNIVLDPGFEAGVGTPWSLVLSDPTAGATVSGDPTDPHGGTTSARIDISATTGRQAAISYQQGTLLVQAGALYRVTLWARASSVRDIRVRITTSAGQTLGNGTNQFTIGPVWTPLTFDFSSILGTDTAIVAIETGQSNETVWVDDVGIARVPPGAP